MEPRLTAFVDSIAYRGNVFEYPISVNKSVVQRIVYRSRFDPGIQTSEETLSLASGSCRDSAVLLCDVFRARGFAARFVSGYLVQLRADELQSGEESQVKEDQVDLHAWAEVFLPGAGWIGFDATSGLICSEQHIPLAAAVNRQFAAPITGTASTMACDFRVAMNIERLETFDDP